MSELIHQRLPKLNLPRVSLGVWPTPIRPLELEGLKGGLWVKDEGRCGSVYGGNKVRKLELLLGHARANGIDDVITMGAAGSNHALATALYSTAHGFRAHVVLCPQPRTDHVVRNLSLTARQAASVHPAWSRLTIPLGIVWRSLVVALANGRRPMFINQGGSDALGTVGWVEAGLEIGAAVGRGELPAPDRVYCSFGSGGTAAGLLVGLRLAGLDSEVVAVQVVDQPVGQMLQMKGLARGALKILRSRGGLTEDVPLTGIRNETNWLCGGYGHADDRVHRVLEEGRAAGLHLEATYTAKSLGRCLEELRGPDPPRAALWIGSLNAQDLSDHDLTVPVPDHLQRLLA